MALKLRRRLEEFTNRRLPQKGRRQLQARVRRTRQRSTPVKEKDQKQKANRQNKTNNLSTRCAPIDLHGLVISSQDALLIRNAALQEIADFGKEPDSRLVVQVTPIVGVPPNGSRLSCALKKDSLLNVRAPPASSAG